MRELHYPDRDVDAVIVDTVLTQATMMRGEIDSTEQLTRRAIAGSERLQLPILRAQLRWMECPLAVWHGGFDLAKEHFRTAVAVHTRTPSLRRGQRCAGNDGSGHRAGCAGRVHRHRGLPPTEWARLIVEEFTDNGVMIMLAAGVAAPRAHKATGSWRSRWSPPGSTTAGPWCGPVRQRRPPRRGGGRPGPAGYASALRERLDPTATASPSPGTSAAFRWHCIWLNWTSPLGDGEQADELLAHALEIAQRGDGKPSILRCRLLSPPGCTPTHRAATRIGADRGAGQRARRGIGRPGGTRPARSLEHLFQALQVGAKLSSSGGRDCWCTARPGPRRRWGGRR